MGRTRCREIGLHLPSTARPRGARGAVRLGTTACPRCREIGYHGPPSRSARCREIIFLQCLLRSSSSFLLPSDPELKDTFPWLAPLSCIAPPPGLSLECVVLR